MIDDDGQTNHPELDEAEEEQDDKLDDDDPAYNASIDERHRVYGQNILPTRKTKSLLQLMWLALKDKVLMSPISRFIRRVSPVYCAAES